ncbi:asparaginase domain-containing protein [Millisia brevis]|uniref:asparaginase domain-containing protein n=1 Tax=Millisia brevis TaxID=264148 RepID=UPI00082975AF|nr:asparaginase domain-containing protein [Millisia brevis]
MTGSTTASTVVLIGTGGTIAARVDDAGVATVADGLPGGLDPADTVDATGSSLRIVDLFAVDSSALTLAQLDRIDAEVRRAAADPTVVGVVVTHGTDTMEETAMLVDLHHTGDAAVAFTGAQRTADHPDPDGPANLELAIAAARDPARAGRTWIAFADRVLPAAGTTKLDTARLDGFGQNLADDAPSAGDLERTSDVEPSGDVQPTEDVQPSGGRMTLPPAPIADVVVDIVTLHVGATGRTIRAAIAAGVDGLVVVALGGGNAHPDVTVAIGEATAAGIPVALTSRTPFGAISTAYGGGGGGHDMAAAGAIPTGLLRASQARIALAAAIAAHRDQPDHARTTFAAICARTCSQD